MAQSEEDPNGWGSWVKEIGIAHCIPLQFYLSRGPIIFEHYIDTISTKTRCNKPAYKDSVYSFIYLFVLAYYSTRLQFKD